tara:strand:+ start:1433 stop:2023 length:591 start_codon:yes stop_codon:yes gene_type:complete
MLKGLAPLIRRGLDSPDAKTALVSLLESYLEQDIVESGSNKGPMVEFFQRDGGGTGKPVPWCALFVSSCLRTLSRCGFTVRNPGPTGRAVFFWQNAEPDQRIERDSIFALDDPRGLVFVRTRLSRPASDRLRAKDGTKTQGHTGIVVSVEGDEVHCIAGNSSGGGHASGSGAVANETIVKGSAQWDRVVGFVRVVE